MFADFNFPGEFLSYRFPVYRTQDGVLFIIVKTISKAAKQFKTGIGFDAVFYNDNKVKNPECRVRILDVSFQDKKKESLVIKFVVTD